MRTARPADRSPRSRSQGRRSGFRSKPSQRRNRITDLQPSPPPQGDLPLPHAGLCLFPDLRERGFSRVRLQLWTCAQPSPPSPRCSCSRPAPSPRPSHPGTGGARRFPPHRRHRQRRLRSACRRRWEERRSGQRRLGWRKELAATGLTGPAPWSRPSRWTPGARRPPRPCTPSTPPARRSRANFVANLNGFCRTERGRLQRGRADRAGQAAAHNVGATVMPRRPWRRSARPRACGSRTPRRCPTRDGPGHLVLRPLHPRHHLRDHPDDRPARQGEPVRADRLDDQDSVIRRRGRLSGVVLPDPGHQVFPHVTPQIRRRSPSRRPTSARGSPPARWAARR